jgi:hypothetical protein
MVGTEEKIDLLAQELRDLDVEVKKLTRNFSIADKELFKREEYILLPLSVENIEKITKMCYRIKEIESALNAVH